MIRSIVFTLSLSLISGVAYAEHKPNHNPPGLNKSKNNVSNNNDNDNDNYNVNVNDNDNYLKQNQDQSQYQAQAQAQKQLQGQNQDQDQTAVGVGLGLGVGTGIGTGVGTGYSNVNVDSSDNSRFDLPVHTAAAIAASHCPNGGASAQWDKFGLSLGQHRDPVCARLDYKASLLAENTLLANVAKLIDRVPTSRGPKDPPTDSITNSLANSIQTVILKNNERIKNQNDAIEEALKPGWFDWMNEVPVLCVLAPNR